MCGLRYVSPLHSSRMRWAAQAQVGTWDGHTHYRRASTANLLTGARDTGAGKSRKQTQTSMGHITESDVKPARGFAPRFVHSCAAHFSSTEDRCWHGNGDDDGREESSLLLHPGAGAGMEAEEAARQHTAIAMILKSRARTAACKLRRRGCCGSASSTALHGARIIVHTLTTTQSSHPW